MSAFALVGMPSQNTLIERALSRCDFPFERLSKQPIPVEWADLSVYGSRLAGPLADDHHDHGHDHVHDDAEGDEAHVIANRGRVLGLAWYSGKVTIEQSLVSEPELAQEVFLAEAAHIVDFFAMTPEQRDALVHAFHEDEPDIAHGHDWFDVGPYSSWMGEGWMATFTESFSDVRATLWLEHRADRDDVRRIMDVEEPVRFFGSTRGKTYHDAHARISQDIFWPSAAAAEADGRRACRTCKPSEVTT